jgi:hypothetical protein
VDIQQRASPINWRKLKHHFIAALLGQALILALGLKWSRLSPDPLWTLLFWTGMMYSNLRGDFVSRRTAFGASMGIAAILAVITVLFQLAAA